MIKQSNLPQIRTNLASSGEGYSMLNTFNPLSGLMGGGDYVPDWALKLVPGSPAIGHAVFKAGSVALLTAGVVGSFRAAKHFNRLAEMREADNPAKKLHSQIGTTFDMSLTSKNKDNEKGQGKTAELSVPMPSIFSLNTAVGTALPLGAMLLASSVAYRAVDDWADSRRNKILDKSIADKDDTIKKLMLARAQIPKGRLNAKTLGSASDSADTSGAYVKEANQRPEGTIGAVSRGAVAALGLLGVAVFGAGVVGSYSYFKASDEGNQKYKAAKKGLKEYAKIKSGMTPITTIPRDAKDYFAAIDGPEQAPVAPKYRPALQQGDLNRPISVSL